MATLKYYNQTTEQWEYAVVGAQGPSGIIVSDTAPESTSGLWLDSDEEAEVPVPEGGTTGQVLAKSSNDDYDTEWANNTLANLDDVDVPSPSTGHVLTYNAVFGKWLPQGISIPVSLYNSIDRATTTYEVDLLVDSNQNISTMPTTLDGVSVINKIVLLVGQTATTENGLYIYDTKSSSWYRTADSWLKLGATFYVKSGTVYAESVWVLTSYVQWVNGLAVNIGSTILVFEPYTPSVQAELDAIEEDILELQEAGVFPIKLNEQTITANYSIPVGYNGLSAGPITIDDGVVVTVPSGSSWSVV
jgi:hypothetical protein